MNLPKESQLPEVLPPLRDDIIIEAGGLDFNGTPTWVIQDPVNNRFFHIGWQENEMLKYWQSVSPADFLENIALHSLVEITENEIEKILTFLSLNCLVQQSYTTIKAIRDRVKPKKVNWFIWLAKNYLFFRIPLVKPDPFLSKSYPYIKIIFSKSFAIFMTLFAFIGLILLQRQWDQFTHTFFELFSLEYILLYGAAVVFAKICHELGHAYTSKKYSLTIPSMGVAFLVMFPMLYTDTTESWKIKRPSQRITVALAGVMIECYLAVFALWLWMLLPNGALKSACFFLSTYSLITTLLININPFLRFDGYHVLSDMLSMRNLQTRSFALTKWKIRELIFHFVSEPPEHFTIAKRRLLIAYAIATWLYRFILFIGIAIMIYYLFFKALGIILFIIEIIYFILQPIYKEIKVWWSMKSMIKRNKNTLISSAIGIILLALFFIPWQTTVSLPASLSYQQQRLFTNTPAQIQRVFVQRGQLVSKGQPLIELDSPSLNFKIANKQEKIHQLKWKIRNIATFLNEFSQQDVLLQELQHAKTQLSGLMMKKEGLTIRAPFNGVIESLSSNLYRGLWVKGKQILVVMINRKECEIYAYTTVNNHQKLNDGQTGYFVPENIDLKKIPTIISDIITYQTHELYSRDADQQYSTLMDISAPLSAYHASTFGGKIAVRQDKDQKLLPEETIFKVELSVRPPLDYPIKNVIRGQVFLKVDRKSIAHRVWDQIMIFLVKEAGF